MKYFLGLLFSWALLFQASGQDANYSNSRFLMGIGAPESLHIGYSQKLNPQSQLGFSAGVIPLWAEGMVVVLSGEHRLYFGPNSVQINKPTFFFRQGVHFLPSKNIETLLAGTLTLGKDFVFPGAKNGLTIDAGIGLPLVERSTPAEFHLYREVGLAFRIQLFFF